MNPFRRWFRRTSPEGIYEPTVDQMPELSQTPSVQMKIYPVRPPHEEQPSKFHIKAKFTDVEGYDDGWYWVPTHVVEQIIHEHNCAAHEDLWYDQPEAKI